jgi:predicted GIY-YIG superfamily endonuclease
MNNSPDISADTPFRIVGEDYFCVYVLAGDYAYVGATTNLEVRLAKHLAQQCKFSRLARSRRLAHVWHLTSLTTASQLEHMLHHLQATEGDSALWALVLDCPTVNDFLLAEASKFKPYSGDHLAEFTLLQQIRDRNQPVFRGVAQGANAPRTTRIGLGL